ncbi:uncharacterized protein LOC142341330 [Convolutriloba macropyga]|uniref:uncharacterized protein LOC142341330 n=1 Tax=Convolutriloba macropyga TaxID=536237 RepID=UPI003F520365
MDSCEWNRRVICVVSVGVALLVILTDKIAQGDASCCECTSPSLPLLLTEPSRPMKDIMRSSMSRNKYMPSEDIGEPVLDENKCIPDNTAEHESDAGKRTKTEVFQLFLYKFKKDLLSYEHQETLEKFEVKVPEYLSFHN